VEGLDAGTQSGLRADCILVHGRQGRMQVSRHARRKRGRGKKRKKCASLFFFLGQVIFLLYHYWEAKEIYNSIRLFIAAYVWMTGFGNFSYYYVRKDFSLGRFCQVRQL